MSDTKYEPADIEVYIKNKGLVLRERSLIAYQHSDGKILAVGTEAEQIAQQKRDGVVVVSPLRRGMIADYRAAVQMFRIMLERTWGKRRFRKPHIVVCGVAPDITDVEKKALEDLVLQLGAREVTFYDGGYETFSKDMTAHQPGKPAEYDIFIRIAKYVPERYVAEAIGDILQYARRQGISADRVGALLQEVQSDGAAEY